MAFVYRETAAEEIVFEDGACADKTTVNPATRPKDATRPFRFIPSPEAMRATPATRRPE